MELADGTILLPSTHFRNDKAYNLKIVFGIIFIDDVKLNINIFLHKNMGS